MNFYKLLYVLVLFISIYQQFVASSYYKKSFHTLSNRKNFSFKKTLLVKNDKQIKTIIVTGKGKSKEKAAMNAAQNALLMASPRYIKKRRVSLYKETMVNDNFMENEIVRTKCQSIMEGRQYSVNCIKSWKEKNNLELLTPKSGEMLIFSSHLIHGLGLNNNLDETRISLEFRLHYQK